MVKIPTIKTARLTLRPFVAQDTVPLHQVFSGEGVLRYFPNPDPPSLDQVQRLVARQLDHWQEHGYGWWAVELRDRPGLIGWSGLQYLPETDEIEVAYLLGRPYWGQGLATEAAKAGLNFAFDALEIENIVAIVHKDNVASQRVAEKAGLIFANEAQYFGMDCFRYSLDRASYPPE